MAGGVELTLLTLVCNKVMNRKFLVSNLENLPRGQGIDLQPSLERIVNSTTVPDLEPLFADIGLRLHRFGMLETHLLPDPKATPAARKRFADLFGMAL